MYLVIRTDRTCIVSGTDHYLGALPPSDRPRILHVRNRDANAEAARLARKHPEATFAVAEIKTIFSGVGGIPFSRPYMTYDAAVRAGIAPDA